MLRELTEHLITRLERYARSIGILTLTVLLEVFNEALKLLLIVVLVYGLGYLLRLYCERNLSSILWPFKGPSRVRCSPTSNLKTHIRQLRGSLTEFDENQSAVNIESMPHRRIRKIDSDGPTPDGEESEISATSSESHSSESSDDLQLLINSNKRNRKISCNLDNESLLDKIGSSGKLKKRLIRFHPP